MKTVITALVLSLALSACAGFGNSSRGSTAFPSDGADAQQDYGLRDATRDYPYDGAY